MTEIRYTDTKGKRIDFSLETLPHDANDGDLGATVLIYDRYDKIRSKTRLTYGQMKDLSLLAVLQFYPIFSDFVEASKPFEYVELPKDQQKKVDRISATNAGLQTKTKKMEKNLEDWRKRANQAEELIFDMDRKLTDCYERFNSREARLKELESRNAELEKRMEEEARNSSRLRVENRRFKTVIDVLGDYVNS